MHHHRSRWVIFESSGFSKDHYDPISWGEDSWGGGERDVVYRSRLRKGQAVAGWLEQSQQETVVRLRQETVLQ